MEQCQLDSGDTGMKVSLSTIGKFHTFDLARQLQQRQALAAIYTGYPTFKLRQEGLPAKKIHTFPWIQAPYMALPRLRQALGSGARHQWEYWSATSFDHYTARALDDCDVFVGLSGAALRTGGVAKARGIRYVCDRGSSHIRFLEQIMAEEHERWSLPYSGIDPRVIGREEAEYELADLITVPSSFVHDSFIRQGVTSTKLRVVPYGVDLQRFQPVATPDRQRFEVLFVGNVTVRKGIGYLLQAFHRVEHPRKRLTLVGGVSPDGAMLLKRLTSPDDDVVVRGHVTQINLQHIMSRSHVMVLPSVEEGLALVLAQALACGCPLISSRHTGALDLIQNGKEGYIVPIRNADIIAERLQWLADDPGLQQQMRNAALARVRTLGGWSQYGERMYHTLREVCAGHRNSGQGCPA
jgi:glycosyltransferase involved in cell wall biosynthesis